MAMQRDVGDQRGIELRSVRAGLAGPSLSLLGGDLCAPAGRRDPVRGRHLPAGAQPTQARQHGAV